MVRRRRYPLIVRLARIEGEVSDAARLIHWLMDDMVDLRHALIDCEDRLMIILGVTGALALVAGASGQAVGDWIISVSPEGDLDDADALGTAVIEELMLNAAKPAGEG